MTTPLEPVPRLVLITLLIFPPLVVPVRTPEGVATENVPVPGPKILNHAFTHEIKHNMNIYNVSTYR